AARRTRAGRRPSPPCPARLALLEKRRDSLLAVLGLQAGDERLHFTLVVALVARLAQQLFDLPDRVRRLLRQRLDVAGDPVLEVVDHELDEAPLRGRRGIDPLARHDQPARPPGRDQPWRALCTAAAGQQPEVDLGEAELRVTV